MHWDYYLKMKAPEFLDTLLYYKQKEEYYAKLRTLNGMRSGR